VADADALDQGVVLSRPLSPSACAVLAGVSYHTILRAIRGGHLRAFHPPGTTLYRIAPEDLRNWLYGHPVAATRTAPEPGKTRPPMRPPARGSVDALTAIESEAA
jgi:excisionase family DNA binding protein